MARSLANIINKGIFAFPAAARSTSIICFSTKKEFVYKSNLQEVNENKRVKYLYNEIDRVYTRTGDASKVKKLIDIELEKNKELIDIELEEKKELIDIELEKNKGNLSVPLRYAILLRELRELGELKKPLTDELEKITLQEKKKLESYLQSMSQNQVATRRSDKEIEEALSNIFPHLLKPKPNGDQKTEDRELKEDELQLQNGELKENMKDVKSIL